MKSNKKLVWSVVLATLTVLFFLFAVDQYRQASTLANQTVALSPVVIPTPAQTNTYFFTAEEEQTAFDLLQSQVEVSYQEYDFGVFIDGVDGLMANDEYFWGFYVNGEFATQGTKQTILQSGDTIEFRYQPVKETSF